MGIVSFTTSATLLGKILRCQNVYREKVNVRIYPDKLIIHRRLEEDRRRQAEAAEAARRRQQEEDERRRQQEVCKPRASLLHYVVRSASGNVILLCSLFNKEMFAFAFVISKNRNSWRPRGHNSNKSNSSSSPTTNTKITRRRNRRVPLGASTRGSSTNRRTARGRPAKGTSCGCTTWESSSTGRRWVG